MIDIRTIFLICNSYHLLLKFWYALTPYNAEEGIYKVYKTNFVIDFSLENLSGQLSIIFCIVSIHKVK